jgi:hypothetical protein
LVFREDSGYYGGVVYVLSPLQLSKDSGEKGQYQEILQAYAEHPDGLTLEELGEVLDQEQSLKASSF